MGGSSSPAPVQQNINNTQIPDYLAPYASNMLNATQAQIFQTNPDGSPNYSSFKPYQPYSSNPSDYFADFSPMQKQAQSTVANLQTPGQYNQAIGITGQAGMKSGMVGNQMGGLGSQMGQAGNQYAQQATDPNSISSYMNPYLQQSLAPQLQMLAQQTGINSAGEQAAATSKGAFGGSREALANSLQQQQGNLAAQQAIGQGYNQAFGNAQQAQQFGANLGLQGQQAQLGAMQNQLGAYGQQMGAANQLAGLGGQQLASQEGIANLQNQVGGQQTQAQQNIINQGVQNYATAQQYPYMQLGVMNAMLRGLPTQQSSTTMYQAPPSTASQLGGLGLAGLGAYGMYNAATGAGHKRGGKITSMATGGAVPMTMMSDQQLQQVQQSPVSSPMAQMYAQGLDQLHGYIHNNPEAGKIMAQPLPGAPSGGMPPPQQMAEAPQNRSGVAAIGTGDMTRMAGGGILAFAKGETVPPADDQWMSDLLKAQLTDAFSGKNTVAEAYKPLAEEQKADLAQQRAMILPEFAFRTGTSMMSGAGDRTGSPFQNFVSGLGTSALGAEAGMQKSLADINASKKLMQQGTISAATADQARRDALLGQLNQAYTGSQNVKAQLANARAIKEAGYASAGAARDVGMYNAAAKAYEDAVLKARTILQNGEMKTTFEVHPEQLDAAAGALAYKYTPQRSREILGLTPPVAPNPAPNPAPAPTTNNPFSSYFLGQPPNVQPNVVPFSSLPQNPTLMPK